MNFKLPRWLRNPTPSEQIADKRAALQDAVATERAALNTSIYETEKSIHAAQHTLRYQQERLAFLDATYPVLPSMNMHKPVAYPDLESTVDLLS